MANVKTRQLGSVHQLPNGKWRVQGPLLNGRRTSLGTYDTEEEAHLAREIGVRKLTLEQVVESGTVPTFRAYSIVWLGLPEIAKSQSLSTHRRRILVINKAEWASLPMDRVTRGDIRTWMDYCLSERGNRRRTVSASLSVIRQVFDAAIERNKAETNPATGLRLKRDPSEEPKERWLSIEEQKALLECKAISRSDRLCIALTMWTGVRKWELMALRITDVLWETRELWVQRGVKDGPTKNKQDRKIPLLPLAYAALREWIEKLPTYCPNNPLGLLFPGRRGGYRSDWIECKWHVLRRRAGVAHAKFHALRHTTATCLVNGLWGFHMPIRQIQAFLGHRSVTQTERYAHQDQSALREAASHVHMAMHTGDFFSAFLSLECDVRDRVGIADCPENSSPNAIGPCVKNDILCTRTDEPLNGTFDALALLTGHPLAPIAHALATMRVS